MNPNTLRARVVDEIERYIHWEAWERTGLAETAEQDSLKEIMGTWKSICEQAPKYGEAQPSRRAPSLIPLNY